MAPTGPAYNIDWVVSNNSNVHVANNREWFTTYQEFETSIGSLVGNDRIKVLGIGDVELDIRREDGSDKRWSLKHGKRSARIVLKDVLYAPDSFVSICGAPIMKAFNLILDSDGGELRRRTDRDSMVLLDKPYFWKLWLKGQPRGMTSLEKGGHYVINAQWGGGERRRWAAHKAGRPIGHDAPPSASGASTQPASIAPYTAEEKAWLKKHHDGEFKFLRTYGLSIYDEAERAEGRKLVRELMSEDSSREEDESEDEGDRFLRELEEDPMSHVADYHFSEQELDWISERFRHSGNFMLSYRLKPFDDEDCREAKAVMRAMMSDRNSSNGDVFMPGLRVR